MKSFSIQNVKSFKDEAKIDIKPITIFVGKNSCGKSSLIRFPVVVSQSMLSDADAPLMLFGKNIDYGNYEDAVFGHSKKGKIHFSIGYECNPDRYVYEHIKKNHVCKKIPKVWDINIHVGLAKYSKRMIVDSCAIDLKGFPIIEITRVQNEKYKIKFTEYENEDNQLICDAKNLHFYKFIPWISVDSMFEQIVEAYQAKNNNFDILKTEIKDLKKQVLGRGFGAYDDKEDADETEEDSVRSIRETCQLIEFYTAILFSVRMQALQDASDIYYIGPFRENPSRVYRDVEHQVDSVGSRGEDVSAMLKSDFLHGKRIITGVSSWFEKSMNYKLTLKDIGSGLYNIVVQKDDGMQDNLIDVGYGISQVLPIVTQLVKMNYTPSRRRYGIDNLNSTFIIEQPELHLHPGAQAELANLFVDVVLNNSTEKSINVLIETHSEHLIRRLQALVANKEVGITNKDVKIYYVDKNSKNEAFVTEMKLLENGQFEKEWPSGFFDKAHELSMELLKNNFS